MDRAELLEQLEIVAPALSESDLIPILTNFWFLGDRVLGYNDQIAISAPCATSFQGAVPGTLLEILKAMKSKMVDITVDGDNVAVKAGPSRIKLGLLPPAQFIFEMPSVPSDGGLPLATKHLKEALECCMLSVSEDTSVPDYLGITVVPKGQELTFYSTTGQTISRAKLTVKNAPDIPRAILSSKFVAQLLRLLGKEAKGNLIIAEDHSIAQIGSVTLFGRLIEASKPLPLETTYAHHVPNGVQLYQIPASLHLMLERAMIITGSDATPTMVSIRNGNDGKRRMIFKSQSLRGEIIDRMEVTEQQPDVDTKFRAKLLKPAYGAFDKMLVTERCVIMARDQLTYLVAVVA